MDGKIEPGIYRTRSGNVATVYAVDVRCLYAGDTIVGTVFDNDCASVVTWQSNGRYVSDQQCDDDLVEPCDTDQGCDCACDCPSSKCDVDDVPEINGAFAVGDMVALRSGGPVMVVDCLDTAGLVYTVWFTMKDNVNRDDFLPQQLVRIE